MGYTLLGSDGPYGSDAPGTLGGNGKGSWKAAQG